MLLKPTMRRRKPEGPFEASAGVVPILVMRLGAPLCAVGAV